MTEETQSCLLSAMYMWPLGFATLIVLPVQILIFPNETQILQAWRERHGSCAYNEPCTESALFYSLSTEERHAYLHRPQPEKDNASLRWLLCAAETRQGSK